MLEVQTAVQMRNITKRFGTLTANDTVNLDLYKGEVLALLGENGAGKSTLMNILYGIYDYDDGEIWINDEHVVFSNPRDAINAGIGMVHQQFMLVPTLTVLENIILGQECSIGKMRNEEPRKVITELCERYNFQLNLDEKIEDLSVGVRQRVEIVKTLYRGADILILDEPTAVLTPQEVDELFEILQTFIEDGKSIILITHKLWEVKRFSNRATIMRHGQIVDTVKTEDVGVTELANMMVGKKVILQYEIPPRDEIGSMVEIQELCVKGLSEATTLKNLKFEIRKGEILGIAGVDGNGQAVLAETLMGLMPVESGRILFQGEDISRKSTRDRSEMGFAYIPEDRMTSGLVLDFSVRENCILNCYNDEPFTKRGFMRTKEINAYGDRLSQEYDLRPCKPSSKAARFSGGNQQKIIIAREFSRHPKFIIAVQPTRGLDIGAAQFVHQKLLEGRAKGAAVCLISADLDEILAVSDRVLVMNGGEIMGEFVPGQADFAEIGLLMGGERNMAG